jgi:PKD repeat protein
VRRKIYLGGAIGLSIVVVVACILGSAMLRNGSKATTGPRASQVLTASFKATPTVGTPPLAVHFTDTSTGSPTSWTWDFGDGTTATGRNPSHIYRVVGKYSVSLVIAGAKGKNTVTRGGYITVADSEPRPNWAIVLDDNFNAAGVPSHWLPYSGSYAGIHDGCAAPSQVQAPGDGYLHLLMQYHSTGICGHSWYLGGVQVAKTYGGVDQAITVRWRVVPSADPDVVRSTRIIPMRWVDDPNFQWYQGEADYCEGSRLGGCYVYLHYADPGQIVHGLTFDLTQWHTFRVEQRNHQVAIYIDDMQHPVWVYKGTTKTIPGAVMRTVLQQECALTTGCPPTSYAGDQEDIQIDWITIENAK